ncbi:MAG TPA: low molecular weight protein-tyrosine-phosphatase [Propioniciclava sp.]|uniref:low molecular weight protein-tyrosine-phosphatase n=1 Tax=Propioniciclava sp. TaxID=2038686 RepID=UPI002D147A26|nr:low molecular weight protein-tyrosine-phosphatase [Propioniciclava sp.]HRL49007.1 low molecular weight protein-tyrosine-phosphatase [Propioniciclava sp.]HRL80500.1 low molecular weight protein-tyrosine-phosphatase [Propioniciclava sp.]
MVFVCWGNICRSPMAERIARAQASAKHHDGIVFTSAGVSSEETGNPIDPRARAVLTRHGYDASGHRAHRITAAEIADADLVIGLEPLHVDRMRKLAPGADHLALLTDFDPDAEPGSGVPDPWYGEADGFEDTLAALEAAMPGILARATSLRR